MLTTTERPALIDAIRALPDLIAGAVAGLSDAQLDHLSTADPWTIRQLVHHVADSHINSFVRMKLLLTEDQPAVKPYDQDAWAQLPDTVQAPIEASLGLLQGLHARWTLLLDNVPESGWQRTAFHPEHGIISLDDMLVMYAAHGADHVAQIRRIREAEGWSDTGL